MVSGNGHKGVLIRGLGPALTALGVPGAISAARLEVFSDSTEIAENDG